MVSVPPLELLKIGLVTGWFPKRWWSRQRDRSFEVSHQISYTIINSFKHRESWGDMKGEDWNLQQHQKNSNWCQSWCSSADPGRESQLWLKWLDVDDLLMGRVTVETELLTDWNCLLLIWRLRRSSFQIIWLCCCHLSIAPLSQSYHHFAHFTENQPSWAHAKYQYLPATYISLSSHSSINYIHTVWTTSSWIITCFDSQGLCCLWFHSIDRLQQSLLIHSGYSIMKKKKMCRTRAGPTCTLQTWGLRLLLPEKGVNSGT